MTQMAALFALPPAPVESDTPRNSWETDALTALCFPDRVVVQFRISEAYAFRR